MIERRDGRLEEPGPLEEVFGRALEEADDVRCVHVGTAEELRRLFEERMRPVVDDGAESRSP